MGFGVFINIFEIFNVGIYRELWVFSTMRRVSFTVITTAKREEYKAS